MYCDFNFNWCLCDTVCKHHWLLLLYTTGTTVTRIEKPQDETEEERGTLLSALTTALP